jgi:DNA-binding NarL/FixJ family response regulator
VTCRILLCDDEPNYRFLLRAVLEPEGVEIVGEAGDGRECLELAEQLRPDYILLDLNMPGMDGMTALPKLRERVPASEVVVLSTASTEEAAAGVVELGARGFVHKPADIFDVPGALRDAITA